MPQSRLRALWWKLRRRLETQGTLPLFNQFLISLQKCQVRGEVLIEAPVRGVELLEAEGRIAEVSEHKRAGQVVRVVEQREEGHPPQREEPEPAEKDQQQSDRKTSFGHRGQVSRSRRMQFSHTRERTDCSRTNGKEGLFSPRAGRSGRHGRRDHAGDVGHRDRRNHSVFVQNDW